ncbi:MAG TPA: NAD-dependent epimerase/dehydratase family protein, partial [Flavisolibacter sp.]|nr:NAD-dependent epimerase/dehydratase family protein [Flavisolibacter sp.]
MKVFITGGGGFLGLAILKQLVERDFEVVSYSRGKYEALEKPGIIHHQGDLLDYAKLKTALQDCEAVFHVAGKAGIWGSYASYYETNVTGTKNIIKACLEQGIRYLVYTSSASVVYGANSQLHDEGLPYPQKFDAYYPQTKAIAEQVVLKANGPYLATCSLRPHLIWGPGDPHLFPRFFSRQQKGQLRLLGKGTHLIDTTYIDDAARAHLQAFDAMQKNPSVAGRAYFLSQDEPIAIHKFINLLLEAGGLPPVNKTMDPTIAMVTGWLLQSVFRLFHVQS